MVPSDPYFLVFTHLCNHLPLRMARNSDLLLSGRWQTSWDVTSEIKLQKDCSFHLAHCLLLFSLFLFLRDLTLGEASYWIMSSPVDRLTWQGTNVSNQQPAKRESCQQPSEWGRKWTSCDLPQVTWVSLEVESSPIESWNYWSPGQYLDFSPMRKKLYTDSRPTESMR